jgi:hypothetical protein
MLNFLVIDIAGLRVRGPAAGLPGDQNLSIPPACCIQMVTPLEPCLCDPLARLNSDPESVCWYHTCFGQEAWQAHATGVFGIWITIHSKGPLGVG